MSPLKITNRKKDALNPHAEATIHITPYTAILRNKRRSTPAISSIAEWLMVIQGIYYGVRGVWPLIAPSSYTALTGSAANDLGNHTSSTFLMVIGIVFLVAAMRSVLSLELGLLMVGCSLGLGLVDAIYLLKGGLYPFFWMDGIEEAVVGILSLIFLQHFTHRRHSTFL